MISFLKHYQAATQQVKSTIQKDLYVTYLIRIPVISLRSYCYRHLDSKLGLWDKTKYILPRLSQGLKADQTSCVLL